MSSNDPSTGDYVNANSRSLRKRLQADFKRSGVGLKGLLYSWVTPDDPSDPESVEEARRRITAFRRILSDSYIRERADLDSRPPVEYVDETRVLPDLNTFRFELSELVSHVGAFQKYEVPTSVEDGELEAVEAKYVQETLANRWDDVLKRAPMLGRFLAVLCSPQRTAHIDRVATADSLLRGQSMRNRVFIILTMLTAGFSRNRSNFFRRVLGIYLMVCGLPRRGIETCQRLGLVEAYKVLNNTLNTSSSRQAARLKQFAQRGDTFVVYDNFNYQDKVQDLSVGHHTVMQSLTTAMVVQHSYLQSVGRLRQSQFRPYIRFTREDLFDRIAVQQAPELEDRLTNYNLWASMRSIFPDMVAHWGQQINSDLCCFPEIERLDQHRTTSMLASCIFEDEGTYQGTLNVHDNLFLKQFGLNRETDFSDRLWLVYGDQKTVSFIRNVRQNQSECLLPYDQRSFMLPVPALFHVQMAFMRLFQAKFWNAPKLGVLSTATLEHDVEYFKRKKQINDKSFKIHLFEPLLAHGFTARILALFLCKLRDAGLLTARSNTMPSDTPTEEHTSPDPTQRPVDRFPATPEEVEEILSSIDGRLAKQFMDEIAQEVFSADAWSVGQVAGVSADFCHDRHYRSQCRLLQLMGLYLSLGKAIRSGDIGILPILFAQLAPLFSGAGQQNYEKEMLYLCWLLHDSVCEPPLQRAILAGSLLRTTTSLSDWKPTDLGLEHVNNDFRHDLLAHRNSSHNAKITFTRSALNGSLLSAIRSSLESMFGSGQSGERSRRSVKLEIVQMALKLVKDKEVEFVRGRIGDCFDAPDLFFNGLERLATKGITAFNTTMVLPKIDNVTYEPQRSDSENDSEDNGEEEGSEQVDYNDTADYLGLLNVEPDILNGYIRGDVAPVRPEDELSTGEE